MNESKMRKQFSSADLYNPDEYPKCTHKCIFVYTYAHIHTPLCKYTNPKFKHKVRYDSEENCQPS